MDHVTAALEVSERTACRVLGQHRSTQRKPRRAADDEAALTQAVVDLAQRYGRHGYRRITALLRAEGWTGEDLVVAATTESAAAARATMHVRRLMRTSMWWTVQASPLVAPDALPSDRAAAAHGALLDLLEQRRHGITVPWQDDALRAIAALVGSVHDDVVLHEADAYPVPAWQGPGFLQSAAPEGGRGDLVAVRPSPHASGTA